MIPVRSVKFVRDGRKKNTKDGVGSVRVNITLCDCGRYVKGNVTKTFMVKQSTVSQVAGAIQEALFGHSAGEPGQ